MSKFWLLTHQPTHLTQLAQTIWLLTVSGSVSNWQPRRAHTISHSWKNITCQTVTHPGTNAHNCCLTSTSSVTGSLPLSYWDKIKVQLGNLTSILYLNGFLSKPPFSNGMPRLLSPVSNTSNTLTLNQHIRHNLLIWHNLLIPFGYSPYQVWSSIDN